MTLKSNIFCLQSAPFLTPNIPGAYFKKDFFNSQAGRRNTKKYICGKAFHFRSNFRF